MREIVEIDTNHPKKCKMCRYRHSSLYRFSHDDEDVQICPSCLLEILVEEDVKITDENELVVPETVSELVDHGLAELGTGDLDGLEDTLQALNDQIPDAGTEDSPQTPNASSEA
jgi:hypothetical protein